MSCPGETLTLGSRRGWRACAWADLPSVAAGWAHSQALFFRQQWVDIRDAVWRERKHTHTLTQSM